MNPTKTNCQRCICEKECSDQKCQNSGCGGCLAGIGGRPLSSSTRSTIEHNKCKCPVLCDDCGETQKNSQGEALCSKVVKKMLYNTKKEACIAMWEHTVLKNEEIGALIISGGRVIVEHNDENDYDTCVTNSKTCSITGKETLRYAGFKERVECVGHIHTHPIVDTTEIKNNRIRGTLLASPADIALVIKYKKAYIVYHGYVFEYFSNSLNSDQWRPIIDKF